MGGFMDSWLEHVGKWHQRTESAHVAKLVHGHQIKKYQLSLLQLSGWWQRVGKALRPDHTPLLERIASFAFCIPSFPEVMDNTTHSAAMEVNQVDDIDPASVDAADSEIVNTGPTMGNITELADEVAPSALMERESTQPIAVDEIQQSAPEPATVSHVIQEMSDPEPAMVIPPDEAAQITEEQWAQQVELRLHGDPVPAAVPTAIIDDASVLSSMSATARALPYAPECLLPCARVLTKSGPRNILDLSTGQELVSGCAGHVATVKAVRRLSFACERSVVRFDFHESALPSTSLVVTSSHSVIAASPVAPNKFRTVLAAEVQDGYILRTILSQKVVRVDHDVLDTDVVEVQLTDVRGSFFAGGPDVPPDNFVEVCGALAPTDKNSVVLLRFQRFDKFREILFENPYLAAVRENLENEGFSVDLGSTDLGPAKLLVRADLAWRVMRALERRCRHMSERLKIPDVVVSAEFKAIVIEEVRKQSPRKNPVLLEENVDLGHVIRAKRTFADFSGASTSSVVTAHSSTDARDPQKNPRKRRATWTSSP